MACARAARGVRIMRVCHAKVLGMELMVCARLRGLLEWCGRFIVTFTNGNDTSFETVRRTHTHYVCGEKTDTPDIPRTPLICSFKKTRLRVPDNCSHTLSLFGATHNFRYTPQRVHTTHSDLCEVSTTYDVYDAKLTYLACCSINLTISPCTSYASRIPLSASKTYEVGRMKLTNLTFCSYTSLVSVHLSMCVCTSHLSSLPYTLSENIRGVPRGNDIPHLLPYTLHVSYTPHCFRKV